MEMSAIYRHQGRVGYIYSKNMRHGHACSVCRGEREVYGTMKQQEKKAKYEEKRRADLRRRTFPDLGE